MRHNLYIITDVDAAYIRISYDTTCSVRARFCVSDTAG